MFEVHLNIYTSADLKPQALMGDWFQTVTDIFNCVNKVSYC